MDIVDSLLQDKEIVAIKGFANSLPNNRTLQSNVDLADDRAWELADYLQPSGVIDITSEVVVSNDAADRKCVIYIGKVKTVEEPVTKASSFESLIDSISEVIVSNPNGSNDTLENNKVANVFATQENVFMVSKEEIFSSKEIKPISLEVTREIEIAELCFCKDQDPQFIWESYEETQRTAEFFSYRGDRKMAKEMRARAAALKKCWHQARKQYTSKRKRTKRLRRKRRQWRPAENWINKLNPFSAC
jgi:hypothetical protein